MRRPTHGAILAVQRLHVTLAKVRAVPHTPPPTPALDAALASIAEAFPDLDVTAPRAPDAMPTFTAAAMPPRRLSRNRYR